MLPCGRWWMTISGNSCWIFHVFARVTATATLLISFLCDLWRIFQLFSWYFCNRIHWMQLWWGKTLEDGWRMYPGLSYTPLMKLEKYAFHNSDTVKKWFQEVEAWNRARVWLPPRILRCNTLFFVFDFFFLTIQSILTVCNTENESTITDAIYICRKPYFGFVYQTIKNGFKCF